MSSSLIPERPLLISPTLAATIGLEEAVMLHVISELLLQHSPVYHEGRKWATLSDGTLAEAMPFWNEADIRRVQRNLQEKGLILVAPDGDRGDARRYAINQQETAPSGGAGPGKKREAPAAGRARPEDVFSRPHQGRATYIPPDWEPDESLYRQCEQHNIPRAFVQQRVKTFVMYQRERRKTQYSWHHAFLKYIIAQWRKDQSYQGAKELESDMSPDWRPSEEAVSILEHGGISRSFIEDSVAEFVLYWRERGLVTSTWNSKFISHVRRQWEKYNTALENDSTPRPIPPDYEPSDACYEVLAMANIDLDFARDQVREFVLYWRDRGEACSSWNTRFLQHVKYRWANRHRDTAESRDQVADAIERMTDRSWAE